MQAELPASSKNTAASTEVPSKQQPLHKQYPTQAFTAALEGHDRNSRCRDGCVARHHGRLWCLGHHEGRPCARLPGGGAKHAGSRLQSAPQGGNHNELQQDRLGNEAAGAGGGLSAKQRQVQSTT